MPVEKNVLANSTVLEATHPYADYYGHVPQASSPNSIFLLTERFYFLEEILALVDQVCDCMDDNINFASASLEYNMKQYPAIRLKHFPDYDKLAYLQNCLKQVGVEFSPKIHFEGKSKSRVQKFFEMREIEPGIYFDNLENNKGYIFCDAQFNTEQFELTIQRLKNNSNCGMLDAVHGDVMLDGILVKIIRVFAENIQASSLKCIKSEFNKTFSGVKKKDKAVFF
jgi:hypothetical protein